MRRRRKLEPWKPEQVAWAEAHLDMTLDEMAEHLGISSRSVRRLLKLHNLGNPRSPRRWSDRDTEILQQMAATHYVRQIGRALGGRDPHVVRRNAQRLGIALRDWEQDLIGEREEYRRLVGERLTVKQIAARKGRKYNAVLQLLKKLGLKATADRRERVQPIKAEPRVKRQTAPRPEKPIKPGKPKMLAKVESAPRERIGIPVAIRPAPSGDTVKYCNRCYCPVIDKPENWAKHNLTIHAAPIFPVPCVSRRIA
jgi:AraC-like DNA-binding protein